MSEFKGKSKKTVIRFKARLSKRKQRLFIEIPKALREMTRDLIGKDLLITIQEAE